MGKKTYFEFLEEEYQALSSQLQTSLALAHAEEYGSISNNSAATMDKQLSRCKAVFQQLRAESRNDREFKERVYLYKIQLNALQEHLTQQQRS
jgi:regulator of sigma D